MADSIWTLRVVTRASGQWLARFKKSGNGRSEAAFSREHGFGYLALLNLCKAEDRSSFRYQFFGLRAPAPLLRASAGAKKL